MLHSAPLPRWASTSSPYAVCPSRPLPTAIPRRQGRPGHQACFAKAAGGEHHDLSKLWEEHVAAEFTRRDAAESVATMVPHATVNHIPTLTGGSGRDNLFQFYSKHFIPTMPPDTTITPVDRTVGKDAVVDEMIFEFTHTTAMPWMLPGVAPTGKHVRIPLVAVVKFEGDKLKAERIYWDQASVLLQLGLLPGGGAGLPVSGAEQADKALDINALPSNAMIHAGEAKAGHT